MDLILSLRRPLSAFLINCLPLGVVILLLSLTLTGIRSLLRHLKENLLWFEKSAILYSIIEYKIVDFSNNRRFSILFHYGI